ncbi:kinase-like domain-containing protein [Tricladium varicosporioides]|nr:kinase-like domain-containing protein [Hymenoscyphus varicosporioides]
MTSHLQTISQLGERMVLPQENRTRKFEHRFSAIISKSKDDDDKRSKSSRLSGSGSAAERRRTYNGITSMTDLIDKSRFSAASICSLDTYCTATSYLGSWYTAPSIVGSDAKDGTSIRRTFMSLLQRTGLTSLVGEQLVDELDWCGRGMHVDFGPAESIPLEICDSAGHGSTSTVDIVRVRRIKLARKLTYMTRRVPLKAVLREVQALQKLKHAHIVQLVGTYRHRSKFAALLYPVADMDLAFYLEEARDMPDAKEDWLEISNNKRAHQNVLSKGSLCLVSALRYVHENGVKHMDIKPANILLKKYEPPDAYINNIAYKLYLCDFGISQVFNPDDQSQTETYPGKTPFYASPEVAADEPHPHGRASDVFSLGCVLAEMATVYSGLTVESLKRIHLFNKPYNEKVDSLRSWVTTLDDMKVSREVILKMLHEHPADRASLIKRDGETDVIDLECPHHHDPPDPFEVDEEPQYFETGLGS